MDFYNFYTVVSRKKYFIYTWKKFPPHLNNVRRKAAAEAVTKYTVTVYENRTFNWIIACYVNKYYYLARFDVLIFLPAYIVDWVWSSCHNVQYTQRIPLSNSIRAENFCYTEFSSAVAALGSLFLMVIGHNPLGQNPPFSVKAWKPTESHIADNWKLNFRIGGVNPRT